MNLGTKKSYYVFSKTDIKKFKEENNKPLEYIDLIKAYKTGYSQNPPAGLTWIEYFVI